MFRPYTLLLTCMLATSHLPAARADEPAAAANPPALTRLFVLGTPHLRSLKDQFNPAMLDKLIERLAALEPDVILVEALPGPGIVTLQQEGGHANEVLDAYGKRMIVPGELAQQALKVDWGEAWRNVSDFDSDCAAQIPAAECILTYLAAYEYDTALLKFRRLDDAERKAFADAHPEIAGQFDADLGSTNEYYTIAQRLAMALGHRRIFAVDAHQEKPPLLTIMEADPAIDEYFERVFGNVSEHPYLKEMHNRQAAAVTAGDLLPFYRWLNETETGQRDIALQWTPFVEKDDQSHFGKSRLALWEMRNFLMAANIARVLAEYPAGTAIFIVGAGHKPFIDTYFRTTIWAEVLEARDVLID